MSRDGRVGGESRARFRRTLASVMAVQIVTLLLLGFLQRQFTS